MKRTILTGKQAGLAAMLLLTLAACSGDDEGALRPAAATAIAFAPETAATRGAAATADNIKDFGVTAFLHKDGKALADGKLFSNQLVERSSGSDWTYTPPQYWPDNADLRVLFYAWSPCDAGTPTVNTAAGNETEAVSLSMDFTVHTDIAQQTDLLCAAVGPFNKAFDTNGNPQSPADKVPFAFSHALSQLSFKVKFSDDIGDTRYSATIHSVTLYAISQGTLTIGSNGTPSWAVNREYETGTIDQNVHLEKFAVYNSGSTEGGLAYNGTDHYSNGTYSALDITQGNCLFMIPQQAPKAALTKPSQLVMPVVNITYTLDNGLQTEDGYTEENPNPKWLRTYKNVSFSLADIHGAIDANGTVNDTDIWEAGKSYGYTLVINRHDITLNIDATDWEDDNGSYNGIEVEFN